MRLQSVSLLFLCYWKRQWGLVLGSKNDRNLASFPHLPFLRVSPIFFWRNLKHGWNKPTQSGSTPQLRSEASKKLHRKGSALGRMGNESRGTRPLTPALCFLLSSSSLFLFREGRDPPALFFLLPFLIVFPAIPQPMFSWQHETTAVIFLASRSPLAVSDKTHLPCSLLVFSLLINENSVH